MKEIGMEDKGLGLQDLYFGILQDIYGITELEPGKPNEIWFNYEGEYYSLYIYEKDIVEVCFNCRRTFKDNDEKLKAVHLFNEINGKIKMVKMFIDKETGNISACVGFFVTGILPDNKEMFTEHLLHAISTIQKATEYFFDKTGD